MTERAVVADRSVSKSGAASSVSSISEKAYIKGWHFCGVLLLAPSEQCQLSMQGAGRIASILPKLSVESS